ncbi:MAG: hemolysin family protein [Candidatus Limnocylindrales bacterium]
MPLAFALVLLNGFFVAAEFALVKVRGTRLAEMAAGGSRTAAQAHRMVGRLDSYLAATQLGITIASLGLGWIGEPAVASLLEGPLHGALGLSTDAVDVVSFTVGFAFITLLHITLGELAPKSIAILRPDATALVVTWPLQAFATVMRPFISVLNGTANLMLRTIGLRAASETEQAHSEEELRLLLASSGDQGVLDDVEQELATRSLSLGELTVREVMVPRTGVAALDAALPIEEARSRALALRHARLPLYGGSIDNITGYVEWFDLFTPGVVDWPSLGHALTAVPESVSVSAALRRMRDERAEIALVLDEYGGTAGILFAEDILDEVAAHELAAAPATLPADTALHQLADLAGVELADTDAVTVGGYVTDQLGHFPRVGERVSAGAWDLVVERASEQHVDLVRLEARAPGQRSGRQ